MRTTTNIIYSDLVKPIDYSWSKEIPNEAIGAFTGWGEAANKTMKDKLQTIDLRIMAKDDCKFSNQNAGQICTLNILGEGVCFVSLITFVKNIKNNDFVKIRVTLADH